MDAQASEGKDIEKAKPISVSVESPPELSRTTERIENDKVEAI